MTKKVKSPAQANAWTEHTSELGRGVRATRAEPGVHWSLRCGLEPCFDLRQGLAQFSAGLADLLGGVRAAAPADASRPELAPGDPQRAQPHAIPLDERTADVLSSLATELGVPGPRSVFAD